MGILPCGTAVTARRSSFSSPRDTARRPIRWTCGRSVCSRMLPPGFRRSTFSTPTGMSSKSTRRRSTKRNATILKVRAAITLVIALWSAVTFLSAIEPDRDFTGNWILMEARSDWRRLGTEPDPFLTVQQDERALRCKTVAGDEEVSWSYALNGSDSKYKVGGESRN